MKAAAFKKDIFFNYSDQNKLMHARVDYTTGGFVSQWISSALVSESSLAEANTVLNTIKEKFPNFDALADYCDYDGYSNSSTFTKFLYTETENYYYAIRLEPIESSHCIYIFVYSKI